MSKMFNCRLEKMPSYYFSKTKPENDITELDQQKIETKKYRILLKRRINSTKRV